METKISRKENQQTMTKKKSENIPCPNFMWKLFQRDGVFYADGRGHGHGKSSLGTRDRKRAIQLLMELDEIAANAQHSPSKSHLSTVESQQPIPISEGWQLYLDGKSGPVHLGGLKPGSKKKYRSHRASFTEFCETQKIACWSHVDKSVLGTR